MIISEEKVIYKEQEVTKITSSFNDFSVTLASFGAGVYDINYQNSSVIITPTSFEEWCGSQEYYGKTVGRNAGRIENGEMTINNHQFTLDKNASNNHLHGGAYSLAFQNFDSSISSSVTEDIITFKLTDKNPYYFGELNIEVTYIISYLHLEIHYSAHSSSPTILSITNHLYFNLSSAPTILSDSLFIDSHLYGVIDDSMICRSVKKVTPLYDFSKLKQIGADINDSELQTHSVNGYDLPYLFNYHAKPNVKLVSSRLSLLMNTDYDSLFIYTYNYPSKLSFTNHHKALKYSGIALEPQTFPLHLQEKLLNPDESYNHQITYDFYKKED